MKQVAIVVIIVTSAAALACSGATRSPSASNCLLSSTDSAYLAGGPVYRGCAVDVRARQITNATRQLDFRPPASTRAGTECYLVELEFVVNASGVPEAKTARILRSSSAQFADAVLAILPEWRYTPAQKDNMPVRQIVREISAVATTVTVTRSGEGPPPRTTPDCPTD